MAWLVLAGVLAIGLTLSLVGAGAPLLLENPLMPASLRYARMIEVGVSNLLFCALAGVLLRKEEERATMPAPPVEPDRS